MNIMRNRVISVFVAIMLVSAMAASTAAPAFAKKPAVESKPDATAFTINTKLEGSWGFWGTFRAQGAVDDSGDASYDVWDYDVLQLWGEHGTIRIQTFITHYEGNTAYGTFWIFAADGAYSGLVDVTGTYTQKLTMSKPKPTYPEDHAKWHLSQTFEGTLPDE